MEHEPHHYPDGTKHFNHVRYRTDDGLTVEVASYVTPALGNLLCLLHNNIDQFVTALRAIPAPDARVREAAEYVLANFKKSEADGYRSRDRQFAIAILDKALALPSSSPSVDGIIEFLSHCGEADIEAGIGALLSIGSEYKISSFKNSLLAALANDQSNCDDKC